MPLTAYPLCVTRYADLGARYDRCVGLSSAIANLLVLRFAERLVEGITRAAPAEDRITFATGRQSFAKASYVDINRSIGDVHGWPPNALQKMLPRKDAPRPLEQTFEQPEFRWSEMDLAQAPADPSSLAIELKIASSKQVVRGSGPAASQ